MNDLFALVTSLTSPPFIKTLLIVGVIALIWHLFAKRGWTSVPASSIHVIDGDTFSVLLNDGSRIKVRPIGYDAPEVDQKGGRMATIELRHLAKRGLRMKELNFDKYNRILAEVRIGFDGKGGRLAPYMLRKGFAHSVSQSGLRAFVDTFTPRLLGRGIWKGSLFGWGITKPRIHRKAREYMGRYRDY